MVELTKEGAVYLQGAFFMSSRLPPSPAEIGRKPSSTTSPAARTTATACLLLPYFAEEHFTEQLRMAATPGRARQDAALSMPFARNDCTRPLSPFSRRGRS